MEPTNHIAERAIRPVVQWRKGSFGTDREQGSRFVEPILTVVTTLQWQQRNVLDYVTSAGQAHRHGQPAPSLLPPEASISSNPSAACRCSARDLAQGGAWNDLTMESRAG